MRIYLLIFSVLFCFWAAGCSASSETTVEKKLPKNAVKKQKSNPKKAMDNFLRGVAMENKGDLASAILEYQEALEYDEKAGIYHAIAKNYYLLGKLSFALQNAHKMVQLDSTEAEYYYLLSDIYTSARKQDSAAVVLEKLLAIDSFQVRAYYRLARQFEDKKPLRAIQLYETLLRKVGKEWNVLFRLAELYEKTGEDDKSIGALEGMLSLDPDNRQVMNLLTEFYMRRGRLEEAHKIADEFLISYPDDAELLELKGRIYLTGKDYKNAAGYYSQLVKNPDILFTAKLRIAHEFFIASLKDSGLIPDVKNLFVILDKDTLTWEVNMYLGAIALEEKNDSTAIDYFEKVTELAPWNAEGWIRLGGTLFDNKKYERAAQLLLNAVERFPEDFTIQFILGLSFAQSDKDKEAEKYLGRAVELNPSDIQALSAYGYTLSRLKRNNDAVAYMNKALAIDPLNTNLLGTLGLIYDALGNHAASDSLYEKVLEIDPENALVYNNYAYALSKRNTRLEEALEMITKALLSEPDNSAYLDTKGWILFQMGNYDEAEKYITRALAIGGDRPVLIDHLGDVYYRQGKKAEAVAEWKKAFAIDPDISGLKSKIERESLD